MRDCQYKRVVIKVGSSSLVNKDFSVNLNVIASIVRQISILMKNNISVSLVTSGAIAVGLHELGLKKRPKEMPLIQACAAIGQAKLMESYNMVGKIFNVKMAQILINHDDFQYMNRMNHLSNTLDSIIKNNVIPVINENDALAVEEIKVGDNDSLASLIAPMINADLLILFSDIDGLYDKNPKLYNDAKIITRVDEITDEILSYAGVSQSLVGTGGMTTKLHAAKIATSSGCDMIICNSNKLDNLIDIVNGSEIGTIFKKNKNTISSRAHYIIYKANPEGSIVIDDGLLKVLNEKKVSILPKGITDVIGVFKSGSVIEVLDRTNNRICKGITTYSSEDIRKLKGLSLNECNKLYNMKKPIIHIDSLVIIND